MTQPTALYRHFSAKGQLLYVGISTDPFRRLKQHKHCTDWSQRVAMIKVDWFPNRMEASVAEAVAIKAEKPKHNVMHRIQRTKRGRERAAAALASRVQMRDVMATLRKQVKDDVRAERESTSLEPA